MFNWWLIRPLKLNKKYYKEEVWLFRYIPVGTDVRTDGQKLSKVATKPGKGVNPRRARLTHRSESPFHPQNHLLFRTISHNFMPELQNKNQHVIKNQSVSQLWPLASTQSFLVLLSCLFVRTFSQSPKEYSLCSQTPASLSSKAATLCFFLNTRLVGRITL